MPSEKESLLRENAELREKNRELEALVRQLTIESENAISSYQTVLNSKWWRLTVPGRKVGTWVKQRFGHTILMRTLAYLNQYGMKNMVRKCLSKLIPSVQPPLPMDLIHHPSQKIYLENKLRWEYKHPSRARILLVSHEMSLTGAPLVLLYMAEYIAQLGYQPVLLAPQNGPMVEEAVRQDIPVIIDEIIFQQEDRIKDLADEYSLVVANTLSCASVVYALSGTEVPVVWWIHESKASYGALPDIDQWPQQIGENVHIYSVCDYAQKLLTKFRPNYQSDILNYYMPDYSEAHPSCDFKLPEHGKRKVFTAIGTMELRKGYEVLAKAVRLLPKEVRDQCYFVIVAREADPEVGKNVQMLCNQFEDCVKHYPLLSRDEITLLHQQTDCLLCTSLDDPLPCVITEALSLGKPVICTENTGYASILREMNSGLIYENNDPALLAKGIAEFIGKPELAKQISANARATYERYFSRDVFAGNVNDLLNRWLFRLSEKEADEIRSRGGMGYEAIRAYDQPQATVSVVIPAYNGGQELDALLSMLEKQTGITKLEIIVVDSGSKDDTVQRCQKHQVHLIQIPNSEFSHSGARNMGADAASGDILLFMTQDAKPTSEKWIANMIKPLLDGEAVAVTPTEKVPEETDLYYRVASFGHANFTRVSMGDQLNMGMGNGSRIYFRTKGSLSDVSTAIVRKVFMRFRYRLNYAEDLDMGLRLLRSGYALKLLQSEQTIHGHNRNAGYYLKRGVVDALGMAEIIHEPIQKASDGCAIADEIVDAYDRMQKILCAMDAESYQTAEAYIEAFEGMLHMPEAALKPVDKAAVRKELADPLVEKTIQELRSYAATQKASIDIGTDQMEYLKHHVLAYMKTQREWRATDTQDVTACLYKHLVVFIATYLVRISPDDPVYAIIEPLMQGV